VYAQLTLSAGCTEMVVCVLYLEVEHDIAWEATRRGQGPFIPLV
jgi:hypothetical protein